MIGVGEDRAGLVLTAVELRREHFRGEPNEECPPVLASFVENVGLEGFNPQS